LGKDFFTEDEVDNIVTQIIKQEHPLQAELKFDSTAGNYRDKLSNISFSSFFELKDLWLKKISQSYFLFGLSLHRLDVKDKILNFVSDSFNINKDKLKLSQISLQVYTPGSFIEPHSDKGRDDDPRVCAVLIPLNSRPNGASGGELKVGEYEYVPSKCDIMALNIQSPKEHEVVEVKDWFRFMITTFVTKI
jgi:Rps23 Pro-64 3,4-dihydroxylase Tpa1-like proline 4-hydroxylase|tara:strand:+ start:63 stop:635 length:573 start_codon:yes stop_codon:yes gene_type:complete